MSTGQLDFSKFLQNHCFVMGKKRLHSDSQQIASSRNIQNEKLDKHVMTTMKIDNGVVNDSQKSSLIMEAKVIKNIAAPKFRFQS